LQKGEAKWNKNCAALARKDGKVMGLAAYVNAIGKGYVQVIVLLLELDTVLL
jgi:hypothetical protein